MKKRNLWFGLAILVILITIWNTYIITAEYQTYREEKDLFEQTRSLILFTRSVADFVHESQKERGLSAAYLGAPENPHLKDRLSRQHLQTDQKFNRLMLHINDIRHFPLPPIFNQLIDSVLSKKDRMEQVRAQVLGRKINVQDEIDYYTSINTDFLGLIPSAAKVAPTREIALRLYDGAMALECKEGAGLERATLANAFAMKQYTDGLYERSIAIHAIHEACMESLKNRVSKVEQKMYDSIIVQKPYIDANNLYNQAIANDFSAGVETWLDTMSDKIDLFHTMYGQYHTILMKDLETLEEETLRRHLIFLAGAFLFGLLMLVATIIMIRKIVRTMIDLRISSAVFDSHEGVVVTDKNGVIIRVNSAFEAITGYREKDVIGSKPSILKSGVQDEVFYQNMWNSLIRDGKWDGEISNKRKNGDLYPESISITAVKDSDGEVTHYVAIVTDISSKKEDEEKIYQLAFFDPLTKLPNRRLFVDRVEHMMAKSRRNQTYAMLAFIDLDNFKVVNDTKGHLIGDELLVEASERLRTVVRSEDTVARMGGDEFVIMAEEIGTSEEEAMHHATQIGEKITEVLRAPFFLDNEIFYVSGSVGISLVNDHQQSLHEILAQADTAMYSAKFSGKNTYRFFDAALQEALMERITLEKEMYEALESDQFVLHYQLQYDQDSNVKGMEALIRWNHPTRGLIYPGEFIPVAEESDLIIRIGEWVIQKACQTLQEWKRNDHFSHILMSVNISVKQFLDENFTESVLQTINKYETVSRCLRLELTESVLAYDVDMIHRVMDELRSKGISFSLDDFGTGYSSLSYLNQFTFDEIKIDQSFIRGLEQENSHSTLVKAIIAMGEALGVEVIAEGIETLKQFELLKSIRCNRFQGYLFARPVSEEQVLAAIFK